MKKHANSVVHPNWSSLPIILFYAVCAFIIDFLYENQLAMQVVFSVLIGVTVLFFMTKRYNYCLGCVFFMFVLFDSAPRLLYGFSQDKFYSILNLKLIGLSVFHLLYMVFLVFFVSIVAKKRRVRLYYPLVLYFCYMVFFGLSMWLFLRNDDVALVSEYSLRYVVAYSCFMLGFLVFYNLEEVEAVDVNRMMHTLICLCLGKMLSSVFLLFSMRFAIWGSLLITMRPAFPINIVVLVLSVYCLINKRYGFALLIVPFLLFEYFRYFQRSTLLSIGVVLAIFGYILLRKQKLSFFVLRVALVMIVLSVGGYLWALDSLGGGFYLQIAQEISSMNISTENLRVVEFINVVMENSENPFTFLLGGGVTNMFEFDYISYSKTLTTSDYPVEMLAGEHFYPHSFFNLYLMKGGVLGLFFYALLICMIFYKISGYLKVTRVSENDICSIALLFSLAYSLIWNFPTNYVGNLGYGVIFGVLFNYFEYKKRVYNHGLQKSDYDVMQAHS